MFFPYHHNISIDELYDYLTYIQSCEDTVVRDFFHHLHQFSWRIIPRHKLLYGKLTFVNFDDLFQFVKFAYIVYPTLRLTLLYQSNETDCKIFKKPR